MLTTDGQLHQGPLLTCLLSIKPRIGGGVNRWRRRGLQFNTTALIISVSASFSQSISKYKKNISKTMRFFFQTLLQVSHISIYKQLTIPKPFLRKPFSVSRTVSDSSSTWFNLKCRNSVPSRDHRKEKRSKPSFLPMSPVVPLWIPSPANSTWRFPLR